MSNQNVLTKESSQAQVPHTISLSRMISMSVCNLFKIKCFVLTLLLSIKKNLTHTSFRIDSVINEKLGQLVFGKKYGRLIFQSMLIYKKGNVRKSIVVTTGPK